MSVYSIPVVFDVNADSEEDAAIRLSQILGGLDPVRGYPHMGVEIESWSMPNNEDADGSDHEGWRLEWVKNAGSTNNSVSTTDSGFSNVSEHGERI